jgi:Type II secretion system (T2SS), protein E, N-terminal domain
VEPLRLSDTSEPKLEFGNGLRARLRVIHGSNSLLARLPELEPRSEPLGALVVEAGLVTPADLAWALEEAAGRRRRLGEILIEEEFVTRDDLMRLLAEQRGMPYVDLKKLDPDPEALRLLPAATARLFRALPLGFSRGLPVVAVADPTDELALARARSFVEDARFVASSDSEILARLEDLDP